MRRRVATTRPVCRSSAVQGRRRGHERGTSGGGPQPGSLRSSSVASPRSESFGLAVPDDSSSVAEFSGRLRHEHARKPGMTVSPGADSAQDRAAVILTPDQRVRVFISSTLRSWLRSGRRRGGRSGGCIWYRCGLSPAPCLIRRRACHRPTWSRVNLCGHLLAAVRLGRSGYGDLGSGG